MNTENPEGKTHFGNLTTFYSLLYTSATIFFIGLTLIFTDTHEFGLIFIFVASILIIITFVLFYIILYRVWKFVIAKEHELGITPSIPSAGQAVGYLFIPLFNIYWLFKGIGKLPFDINLIAKKYDVQKVVQDNLGYIIAILALIGIIPFVGYITGAINFLILLPIFIARCVEVCELVIASDVSPDKTTEIIKVEKISWQSFKEFSLLFDIEKYGINYFIGIALFISLIIVRFMRLSFIGGFDDYLMPELDYFLIGVAIDSVVSALFVITCHLITKNWMQPFIWGAKIWSLIAGFILSYIVYKAMSIALGYGPFLTEINFDYIFSGMDVVNLFGRIFTALLFFGALFIHFDNLQSKKALQKTVVE
jgi:hypothetical protein